MILSKNECETILAKFSQMDRCLIDTSSLIYLHKIEAMALAESELTLLVPEIVVDELGFPLSDKCRVLSSPDGVKADDLLLSLALEMKLPLISEDGPLLKRAQLEGLDFYNTLMILLFILYKECITESEYRSFITRLEGVARYNKLVWAYGESLESYIKSEV